MESVQILVRVVDKKGDAAVDASKRGDVIAVMPGAHVWSQNELGNDDWRIIVTTVPDTFIASIMSVMMTDKLKRRREWSVDLDRLPNPELYRGPRTRPVIAVDSDHLLRTTQRKVVV